MISPWLRFGLPMGSALILLAFLETTLSLFYILMDFGGDLALQLDYATPISGLEIVMCLVMIIQLLASFVALWYGVVLKGEKSMMIAWMTTTAITAGIVLSLVVAHITQYAQEISYAGIFGILYSVGLYMVYVAYVLFLGYHSLPMFGSLEEISPVGKGFNNIISYFMSSAQDSAMLAVMSEIVLNTELFLERQVLRFVFGYEFIGHERDNSAAILTEEIILRFIRIVLCCVGFFLIFRGKQQWLLKWCVAYGATILVTVIIFIYLIFAWSAEHIILTLNYYILLLVNLFYRAAVLFICLRYTDVFTRHATHLREVA